ncbi:tubby C 2 family protein [Clostridium sporogenes]|uniref:LURP-one-related/scramblase family protein n=1 Tax=Clostridium TaxID=1485 RepID=UPI00090CB792|nr:MULTISPECIES: LURP-one-related family protein [Clostridium]APF26230.1 tubby C 2 family protein [Clostridium sporogenes]MDI6921058.1 LURP-one-related family protein [Clostridium botulinum]WMU98939.1 LURP-one-related family protein [Clostridium botulinum]
MKFIIKQKLFSITDKYIIENEYGEKLYKVQKILMSMFKKIKIYDIEDRELVYIKEKFIKILPTYLIYMGGNQVATMKKDIGILKPRFTVESIIGDYEVKGDILDINFTIEKAGETVARVKKHFPAIRDSYEVDIKEGASQSLVLAMVIIIDDVVHNTEKEDDD